MLYINMDVVLKKGEGNASDKKENYLWDRKPRK
jgi:hypothetical protein